MNLTTKCAALSHPGLVREVNEDNWSADAGRGLFIVSDGIGGQFAGDLASKLVVEALPPMVCQCLKGMEDLGDGNAEQQLKRALVELSTQVRDQAHGEPGLEGLGATVVVAIVRGNKALIGHMGDSRAYLLRGRQLQRLTKDHSIVQLLLDAGEITVAEAASHPSRGQITRSVGMEGEPLPATSVIEIQHGDRMLLCTDGLTNIVSDDEILAILQATSDLDYLCQLLVKAANDAGGKDNVTAVVVDLVTSSDGDDARAQ